MVIIKKRLVLIIKIILVRPYKCTVCDKTFAMKPNLTGHMVSHAPKIYDCKVCNLHHQSAAKLRQHIDQMHPEQRPLFCNYCQKSFKLDYALKHHMNKHHSNFDLHLN